MDPDFFPYKNESKDGFFENRVIKDVYEKIKLEDDQPSYIGVTSWKMSRIRTTVGKTLLIGKDIIDFIQKDIDAGQGKDVYIYSPINGLNPTYDFSVEPPVLRSTILSKTLWDQQKEWGEHPHAANMLLNDAKVLPFDIFDGKWIFCHCNYFIAKTAVFNEYCEKVLIPFINFFEREDIKNHPASVEWYNHPPENKKYPSYSFTGEALFGSFLAHSNYTYKHICKIKRRPYWVRIDGCQLYN